MDKLEGGIYKKVLRIMENVEYLAKDDTISYKDVKYKGLSEEKVTRVMREELVKHDVIVFPIKQEHHREGMLTTVDVTYRLVDTEDGSYVDVVSSGTGSDTQDKGVGKAMTYCFKYMWLRTFALPTGEDPDKISSAELDDRQKEDRIFKGKKAILDLLADNHQADAPDGIETGLTREYVFQITTDVDQAVKDGDVEMLETIYKDVKSEVRKLNASETKARSKESFDKAAKENGVGQGEVELF